MLVDSRTFLGGQEPYTLDANRLRLEWKGPLRPGIAIEVQYDNEVLLGNYLGTAQARLESQLPRRTYWDLQDVYARGQDVVARHRLRRAAVTFFGGATDVRFGRQRVAWGTGRFWSPLDLLNPVDPTSLEPGEREGVDAVLLEHKRSAVSRATFVLAPVHHQRDHALGQWHDNLGGLDYSLTAGQVSEGTLIGVDAAGQLGGAGYDIASLLAGRRQSVARRYAGLYARHEFTPLVKWESWLVHNLDDRSLYFSPRVTWSVRENLDLAVGAQLFAGSRKTEFGIRSNLRFAYVQWFF